MALTGEFQATDYQIGFLEPGSATNYYDLSTYVNGDSLSRNVGTADTTCHGVSYRTFIAGMKSGELSFTLLHNTAPALAQQPQTRVRQLLENRTVTTWRIRERGTGSGLPETTFQALVTGMVSNYANDDAVVSSDVTLTVSGTITDSTQAG